VKESITVNIFGKDYKLASKDTNAETMKSIASLLNTRMLKTAAGAKVMNPSIIAVMTALNLLEENIKLKRLYKYNTDIWN